MKRKFVITVFGKDRPGIVADVSQLLFENNCNLEDSSMGRLADQFAVILLFTGYGESLKETLSRECRRMEVEKGLSAFVRELSDDTTETAMPVNPHVISVKGLDHSGIVYRVSRYLAHNGVNITDFRSKLSLSPESGEALYTMEMRIDVPQSCSMDVLKEGLDLMQDQLNVDINLD